MLPVALFDTNIWVSALLNPSGIPARLLEQWVSGRVAIVISLLLLEELSDVLSRPRLHRKYGLHNKDIGELLRLLAVRTSLVPITGRIRVCRDPDDNMVIETAIAGWAAYIVTRDDDLKRDRTVRRYLSRHKIRVVTVDRFLTLITSHHSSR